MDKFATLNVRRVLFSKTKPHPENPRIHPAKGTQEYERLRKSMADEYFDPLVWNKRNGKMVSGHYRRTILMDDGFAGADMVIVDWDEKRHKEAMLAANVLNGQFDEPKLLALVRQAEAGVIDPELTGYTDAQLKEIIAKAEAPEEDKKIQRAKLADRFGVPPFSVLDARQGYWQERKSAWLSLGIQSEVGRGGNLLKMSDTVLQPDPKKRETASLKGGLTFNTTFDPYRAAEPDAAKRAMKAAIPGGGLSKGSVYIFKGPDGKTATGDELAKTFGTEGNVAGDWSGTSIFDPVLSELAYRWFCPSGGAILDPFAGGSVRGIVAAWLGRKYHGIDLRPEQVAANRAQWEQIAKLRPAMAVAELDAYHNMPTPYERYGEYWFKRDDLYSFGGATGGKARILRALAQSPDIKGIVTCGDRMSTMLSRAAQVARALGKSCVIHTADGDSTPGVVEALSCGAEVVRHQAGRLSVLKARAKQDAIQRGFQYIPWALECQEAVEIYAGEFRPELFPKDNIKRLVVPVGSGMALAGLLTGMARQGISWPVLGVKLGGEVEKRLDAYAPKHWRSMAKLVDAKQPFHDEAPRDHQNFLGVPLDPIYESKCVPFLQPGDCLWIVGRRTDSRLSPLCPQWTVGDSRNILEIFQENTASFQMFDLIFSCPPYFDLEQYSDSPDDLSNALSYSEFMASYRDIIKKAVQRLKRNRFAVFVVGDIRDDSGLYRNFVSGTIQAFRDAGMDLYNEAILVTAVGSLPLRVGRQFVGYRKLGKTHQNVLVFIKGDPKAATDNIGPVEFGELPDTQSAPEDNLTNTTQAETTPEATPPAT